MAVAMGVPTPISIHAPREGGDPFPVSAKCCVIIFQSTPPARGATYWGVKKKGDGSISIHAPREGGDAYLLMSIPPNKHFNPRPPRGGRLLYLDDCVEGREISIHAPREGGDYGYCITQ